MIVERLPTVRRVDCIFEFPEVNETDDKIAEVVGYYLDEEVGFIQQIWNYIRRKLLKWDREVKVLIGNKKTSIVLTIESLKKMRLFSACGYDELRKDKFIETTLYNEQCQKRRKAFLERGGDLIVDHVFTPESKEGGSRVNNSAKVDVKRYSPVKDCGDFLTQRRSRSLSLKRHLNIKGPIINVRMSRLKVVKQNEFNRENQLLKKNLIKRPSLRNQQEEVSNREHELKKQKSKKVHSYRFQEFQVRSFETSLSNIQGLASRRPKEAFERLKKLEADFQESGLATVPMARLLKDAISNGFRNVCIKGYKENLDRQERRQLRGVNRKLD